MNTKIEFDLLLEPTASVQEQLYLQEKVTGTVLPAIERTMDAVLRERRAESGTGGVCFVP